VDLVIEPTPEEARLFEEAPDQIQAVHLQAKTAPADGRTVGGFE
jgi:hypothetical protein